VRPFKLLLRHGFITELNAAGAGLIFSTYLGGSHGDDIANIALDPSANIQVTGQATSTDFPTANAFQATLPVATAMPLSRRSPLTLQLRFLQRA